MSTLKPYAIITGASSGIGAAISQSLDQQGWELLLMGRSEEKLKSVQSQLSGQHQILSLDLDQDADVLKEALNKKLGATTKVNALINNAGIYRPQAVDDDTSDTWDQHFQTNLMGPVKLTRCLWERLKKQNDACIINISSTLGLRPIANTSAYSALKSALNSWTQSLALEGAAYNIRANAICPGLVNTPIHDFHGKSDDETLSLLGQLKHLQPIERVAEAKDISEVVAFFCSPKASWVTGAVIPVDGGIMLTSKDPF